METYVGTYGTPRCRESILPFGEYHEATERELIEYVSDLTAALGSPQPAGK